MPFLPWGVAAVVDIGPLIDDTDFKTIKDAPLTYASFQENSIYIIKNSATASTKVAINASGTPGQPTNGGSYDITHLYHGVYQIEIPSADLEFYGSFRLVGVATSILPFESPVYNVVTPMVYNSLYNDTDILEVDVVSVQGGGQAGLDRATALGEFCDGGISSGSGNDGGVILTNTQLQDRGTGAGMVTVNGQGVSKTVIAEAVWDTQTSECQDDGSFGVAATDTLEDTAVIGALGAGLTAITGETDKIGTIPALDGGDQTIGAAIAKLVDDNDGADYDAETDSLQKFRDHIGDGTNLSACATATGFATPTNITEGIITTVSGDVEGDIKGAVDGSVGSVTAEVDADVTKISGSVAAANNLEDSALTIVKGTVAATAGDTTYFFSDDITEDTEDHFKGRIVVFVTGADVQYQATDITAYELDGGEGKFTVTALTTAPPDNATFVIV